MDCHKLIANYYQIHYQEMLAFACKRLDDDEMAKDLVQDTCIRLLSLQIITEITLPCLIYTTMRNLIMDYWRRRQAVERAKLYMTRSDKKYQEDTFSMLSAIQVNELLEYQIARLDETNRKIIRMDVFEGKKLKEIATVLHMNYKTVESRLGMTRKKIRQYMRPMLASV